MQLVMFSMFHTDGATHTEEKKSNNNKKKISLGERIWSAGFL